MAERRKFERRSISYYLRVIDAGTNQMLGHRFGEFSPTRGKVKHGTAGIGSTKGSKSQAKK